MAAIELTAGAIIHLTTTGEADRTEFKPVLQVADIRLVNTQNQTTERYRLLLSDGEFSQQGMLATQHNALVKSNQLQKGSIIRLNQFVCNLIQNRSIVIIIDLDVILDICDPIGMPKPYPAKTDGNPNSVSRSSSPGQPLNQAANIPPSYGTGSSIYGSAPRPTMGGGPAGSQVQPSGENYNAGSHSYGNSFSGNLNSGKYNPSNAVPVYPKHEVGSPPPRAPLNNYVRPPNPSYHQPSPNFANRGPIAKNETAPRIIPIAALNPYQGRWTIKARVTAKSELRQYSNPRGEGKVFSFDLLDSDGGEIRVTCFNAAADQFYHQIEPSRVYMISRGTLKPAQKNFNHLHNDHEIMLDSTSDVQPCYEDDRSIPQQQFHFRPISDIEGLENNSVVDLIAIVSSINPSSSIMRKNGTETLKRTLQLKDSSGRSVELTLWGNFCNAEGQTLQTMCDSGLFPVLALKSGRVNDFNGKSVGTISTSQLFIEPDFPEVQELKSWFHSHGKTAPAISLSREAGATRTDVRKTISQIKDEKLGTSEKPDWISVSATLTFIKADNFCYTACPLMIGDRQCNKKVTNNGDGKWRCERCDQSFDECDYRYILQMQIQDHTGLTWVTAFQETGEEIMGRSAKELYYMKYEEQDDDKFAELVRDVLFTKFLFKLKVKEETFSDEQRVKSTVVRAEKLNFLTESKYLLDSLAKSKEGDFSSVPLKSEGMPTPGHTTSAIGGSREPTPVAAAMNYNQVSSNVAREGSVNTSQYGGNQYGGGARYPSSSGMFTGCGSCGSSGHNSANCPSLMTGPGQSSYGTGGGNREGSGGGADCYKCKQPGHWARDCPGVTDATPAYGGGGADCYKCKQPGHWARDCPGVTDATPAYGGGGGSGGADCFKCKQPGHWARDCPSVADAPPAYGTNYGGGGGGGGGRSGDCHKCHQPGHWARDCPGVANNSTPGRYGMPPKQYVGGF